MIVLTNRRRWLADDTLDFTTQFPGWGVQWDRDEDRLAYESGAVQIPGGRFYNLHANPTLTKINIVMITNNLSLYRADEVASKITDWCIYSEGSPKVLYLSKEYDRRWSRKVMLTGIKMDYGTKFHKINLEFSLVDNRWYGENKTYTETNITLDPINKNKIKWNQSDSKYYPVDYEIRVEADMKGKIYLEDPIVYYDAPSKHIMLIDTRTFQGAEQKPFIVTLESERHRLTVGGQTYPSPVKPGTVLDRDITIHGTGTVSKIEVTYRECKI